MVPSGTKLKNQRPVYKSCNFADKDGNLTDSYTKWLKTARQTFETYNGGTVINVLYKVLYRVGYIVLLQSPDMSGCRLDRWYI